MLEFSKKKEKGKKNSAFQNLLVVSWNNPDPKN